MSPDEPDALLDTLFFEGLRVTLARERLRDEAKARGEYGAVIRTLYDMDRAVDDARTAAGYGPTAVEAQRAALAELRRFEG